MTAADVIVEGGDMHGLRVLVSPVAGRLRLLPPKGFRAGREWIEAGQPVARVQRGGVDTVVVSPVTGWVREVLGIELEPVSAGRPLIVVEAAEGASA